VNVDRIPRVIEPPSSPAAEILREAIHSPATGRQNNNLTRT
jgi:hypothetical protein